MNIAPREKSNIGRIVKANVIAVDPISVTYEIVFEFDIFETVSRNVSNVSIEIDTVIDNKDYDNLISLLTRKRDSFRSYAAWLSYLNWLQKNYDRIRTLLNAERNKIANFKNVLNFSPTQ